jgi:hypothetical protein
VDPVKKVAGSSKDDGLFKFGFGANNASEVDKDEI